MFHVGTVFVVLLDCKVRATNARTEKWIHGGVTFSMNGINHRQKWMRSACICTRRYNPRRHATRCTHVRATTDFQMNRTESSLIYPILFVPPSCPSVFLAGSFARAKSFFFPLVFFFFFVFFNGYLRNEGTYLQPERKPVGTALVRQQFSPPGNLRQFFIARHDNVSAPNSTLPRLHPRKSVPPPSAAT